MPMETIIYVTFVIAALAEFAAVLAYAEWATRRASATAYATNAADRRSPAKDQDDVHVNRKMAA